MKAPAVAVPQAERQARDYSDQSAVAKLTQGHGSGRELQNFLFRKSCFFHVKYFLFRRA